MSQAIIDFCDRLKTTLLGVEERLDQAKASLESSVGGIQNDAHKHVEEAAEILSNFRINAGEIIAAVSQEIPDRSSALRDKLSEFGAEAQVALRHAAVFLAEATSKGADSAANALHSGARQAQHLAEELRRQTAIATKP